MSTDTSMTSDDDSSGAGIDGTPDDTDVAALRDRIEALEDQVAQIDAGNGERKMTIIATKGTLDMAYPPLILASTAAAFGWDVIVFHTFWALDILNEEKSKQLKLSAVGNPSLPMPNVLATLPGMDTLTTRFMERKIEQNGTPSVEELIELSLEQGVELQACQMTMDLMGYEEDEMYAGVTTGVGAATALEHMADADVQLLI